jgi:hypothetical protein
MRRFTLLAVAAASVLAVAGLASATPRLIVSGTTVQVLEDKTDAAPLKITIYVPTGYTASLAQTVGSQIGTVHADLQALQISPDAIIQADGAVLVADPSSGPLKASATQCTGTATHAAVWLLHVTVSGTTLDVPIYVDPTSGAATALGVATLQLCLSDPYDNAGPARAAFGAKIVNAQLKLNDGILSGPGGLWRSTITPWNTTTPAPDAAHTVEAQSIVSSDAGSVSLKAAKAGKGKAKLSGKVTQGGSGVSGATVTLTAGGKKVATLTTSASGAFSKTVAIKKATKFQAKATLPQRDTSCVSPLPTTQVPGGCVATIAGSSATSKTITAKP